MLANLVAWRVWRAIRLFLEQNRLGALPSLLLGTAGFLALTLPLLLGALLLEEPGLLAWALLVTVLVLLFVFTMVTFQRPAVFITVFVLWFALQRVLVAVVAPEVDADMVRLLLVYKEGFYLVLPAAGVAYLTVRYLTGQGRFTSILLADVLAVLFLALLAVSFLASDVDFTPRLTYLRRFAAPVFLYLGGRLLLPGESQLREGLRIALLVILAVALFGLVERFLLDISFWRNVVDAEAFYSQQVEAGLIPESWLFIYRGVPDGVFIALPLSVPVRRLVSTFLEPTTLGAFLAFGLLLFLLAPAASGLRPGKLTALAAILATLAITATLSRGAMLLVVSAAVLFLAVVFLRERKPQQLLRYGTWSPVLALLAVGIVITTFSFSQTPAFRDRLQDILQTSAVSGLSENRPVGEVAVSPTVDGEQGTDEAAHPPGSTAEGASTHLSGLKAGLGSLDDKPLGSGLGSRGNWGETPDESGESMIGTLAAQLGLPGLVFWMGFLAAAVIGLVQASWAAWREEKPLQAEMTLALGAALFGLHVSSWFSESASGLLGNALFFLFAGWALAWVTPTHGRPRFLWLPNRAGAGEPQQ